MEHDLLAKLLSRLEAGTISAGELDQLEQLLASDYEARELYLDHAQVEGLLYGIGKATSDEKVVSMPAEAAVAAAESADWRRWLGVASGIAAALIVATAITGPKDEEPVEVVEVPRERKATKSMTAEERYDRAGMNGVGGASNVHPETASNGEFAVMGGTEFNRDIRPILSDKCFACHGPDEAERKGDLRLDTEEGALRDLGGYAAIVKGDAEDSELFFRIHDEDPNYVMPPPESRQLTSKEKNLLERWINQGAPWQQHWAFELPVKRELPEVTNADDAVNAVDHFVLAALQDRDLEPSTLAEKETLIRRVSLDLTGLPPSVEEVDAFLADESPDAYEKLVDRLLHSDAHAERMAWQWMEAARYADTDGYQNDGPRTMWRWRDWVIEAYKNNMPFDQFTIEQLAGDLLPNATMDQIIATGFNRNNRYNSESGLVLEEFLLENAVDRVDTTMTVWMGLTMACSRCHDHKYDPLSQKDYYQLISFFDNITESGRAIKHGNSEPWIRAPTREQAAKLSEIEYRLEDAQKKLDEFEPGVARRQMAWEKVNPDLTKVLLAEGLTKHFAIGEPIETNGKEFVELEPVTGIASEKRFTMAFQMTPGQVDRGAVLSNEGKSTTRKGFFVNFKDGHLRFALVSRRIAGVGMLETVRTFEPGETVHVTLTNDGTQRARGISIWINGEKVETREIHNTNSNTAGNSNAPLMVGGSTHAKPWKGVVGDLRVYSGRTFGEEEVVILAERSSLLEILAKKAEERTGSEAAKLRSYFIDHGAVEQDRRRVTAVKKIESERVRFVDSLPTSMVMEEAPEPKDTFFRIRGEYHNRGEVVLSDVPEVFPGLGDLPADRLGFAKWLMSEENPLVARVAVNQYWQMIFGTGLVKTAEDFGTQGSLPTHPDLLDWLAIEFRESGWDTRHMLKTLVMSRTYRQSSALREGDLEKDPNNVFLARAPRLKLPGSMLRDQALVASGLLVADIGGASVKPYQPARMWKEASNFSYKQDKGDKLYRRSLYTYWKRTLAPPSMAVLDSSDREWCSVKPKRTNTPLQALTLMNETAFFEAARKLGERMVAMPEASAEERVIFGFRSVLSRTPEPAELDILTDAYQRYLQSYRETPDQAEEILTVGESGTDGSADRIELAAATAVANVILNLEEASVRE